MFSLTKRLHRLVELFGGHARAFVLYFNRIAAVGRQDASDPKPPVGARSVERIFKQPKLFLIRDLWLDSFPDTIQQFGRMLVKKGDEFYMAKSFLNEYTVIEE